MNKDSEPTNLYATFEKGLEIALHTYIIIEKYIGKTEKLSKPDKSKGDICICRAQNLDSYHEALRNLIKNLVDRIGNLTVEERNNE